MKRLLLALVPIVLLATVAYPGPGPEVVETSPPFAVVAAGGAASSAAPLTVAQAPYTPPTTTTTQPQPQTQQPAPPPPAAPAPAPAPETQESVPFVVDKTQLVEAAALLEQAIQHAKLAVDSAGAQAQQMHIQESINFLAGSANVNFKPTTQTQATVAGVTPLLTQALSVREAAEQQWLAALDQRDAQIYVAGPSGAVPPAATSSIKLSTQGLRPEEQASLLVNRAILQATEALRLAAEPAARTSVLDEQGATWSGASSDAADMMTFVIRQLEAAQKIVQIALNR